MISVHYYNIRLYFIIYSINLSFYFYYCYLILGWRAAARTAMPAKAKSSGSVLPGGAKSKETTAQFSTTLHLSNQGPGVHYCHHEKKAWRLSQTRPWLPPAVEDSTLSAAASAAWPYSPTLPSTLPRHRPPPSQRVLPPLPYLIWSHQSKRKVKSNREVRI